MELGGFGVGGSSHAGKSLVQLEIILNGHGRHGLRLILHLHAFFGFNRLMQTVGPLTTHHLAPSILIDNHHAHVAVGVLSHHIVAVKLIDNVRADGLLKQVRHVHIFAHIKTSNVGDALRLANAVMREHGFFLVQLHLEKLLELIALGLKLRQTRARLLLRFAHLRNAGLVAGVTNVAFKRTHFNAASLHFFIGGGPRLLRLGQFYGNGVCHFVAGALPLRQATDNQRSARLVNQNTVHFVNDGEVARALHLILGAQLHVVAQIIKAKFSGGSVHNIATVRGAFFLLALHVLRMDGAHGQAKRAEKRKGPVAIALHQIIIHGHHMHLLALA